MLTWGYKCNVPVTTWGSQSHIDGWHFMNVNKSLMLSKMLTFDRKLRWYLSLHNESICCVLDEVYIFVCIIGCNIINRWWCRKVYFVRNNDVNFSKSFKARHGKHVCQTSNSRSGLRRHIATASETNINNVVKEKIKSINSGNLAQAVLYPLSGSTCSAACRLIGKQDRRTTLTTSNSRTHNLTNQIKRQEAEHLLSDRRYWTTTTTKHLTHKYN